MSEYPPAPPRRRRQHPRKKTLSLRRILTSGEINVTWKKASRTGTADNTPSLTVKAKKISRKKVKEQTRSKYRR
jgi:hypothetical protein